MNAVPTRRAGRATVGSIVVGGPGSWSRAAVATFLRLRAEGAPDRSFGPRLLTLRQTSARLRAHPRPRRPDRRSPDPRHGPGDRPGPVYVIDEAVRVEALDVPVVVRRR